jgi:hypothetical protein
MKSLKGRWGALLETVVAEALVVAVFGMFGKRDQPVITKESHK